MRVKSYNNAQQVACIGVGGCGMNLMKYIADKKPNCTLTIAVNREAERLSKEGGIYHRILLDGLSAKDESRELKTPVEAEVQEAIQDHWLEIESSLRDIDSVWLLAGLGGATGSWASLALLRELKKAGKRVSMVATAPFDCERRRMRIARKAQENLRSADYLLIAPNQQLMAWSNSCDSMGDAFAIMNQLIFEAWMLIEKGVLALGHYRIAATGAHVNAKCHELPTTGFGLIRIQA